MTAVFDNMMHRQKHQAHIVWAILMQKRITQMINGGKLAMIVCVRIIRIRKHSKGCIGGFILCIQIALPQPLEESRILGTHRTVKQHL